MKRVFKIFAAALATLCAFAVTGACDNKPSGDVTPDSKKYKATEEELLAEYEATPYKEPVRGIFITPRIKASASQEVFDEEYAKVKAAGINMVATYQEANAKKFLEKTLTACEKNGLKVILSMNRITNVGELENALALMRRAQEQFATFSQEQVDEIFRAAAMAAGKARIPLAKMAVEETGMGVAEDKVIKNHYAAEYIYNTYRNTKTCGVLEEDMAS